MSRKRRIFDIPAPDEVIAPTEDGAEDKGARRGPMASAVRENADSLRERRTVEEGIRAENDALAHEHVRLKRAGLITDMIPVHKVDTQKLSRDRKPVKDDTLEELKTSIIAIGLSNPIRVEQKPDGRFELIQGWRRLQAFRELEGAFQDGRFTHIPAGYVATGDTLETSYRRMVDENLVRKDVSFAEMALLARAYAADPATACEDIDKAVAILFRSAGYQKRSYIRAFAELLDLLDGALRYPEALGRNLGLDLRKRLEGAPASVARLRQALDAAPTRDSDKEAAILRGFLGARPGPAPDMQKRREASGVVSRARTTLRVSTASGEMRCVVANGRLEVRGPSDFTAVDPRRLETALAIFLAALTEPEPDANQ